MKKYYNFKDSFKIILSQVNPNVTQIQKESKDLLNYLLIDLSVKVIQTINSETVLHTDIIVSTRQILSEELAKYAIDFMMKAVEKYDNKKNYTGLQFKISTSHAILKDNISKDQKIHETAPVALAALLEYILAEIIELSANATCDKKRRRIKREIVIDEIINDVDLHKLFIGYLLEIGNIP